jgi:thioesterase domain-containing protein
VTETTPAAPFSTLAAFFLQKIREKQPSGPYRLASFSLSSVITLSVAKLLEDSGQQVIQLCFIDHFPLLWVHEATELLLREEELSALVDRPIMYMIELLRHDPLHTSSKRIEQLETALSAGPNAAEPAFTTVATTRRLAASLFQFLRQFYPQTEQPRSYADFADPFKLWVESVKAPLSVLIAEFGMKAVMPESERGLWADLGASRCHSAVRQCVVGGVGHFGMLADKRTATFLQQYNFFG